jgi:hypothetical protein
MFKTVAVQLPQSAHGATDDHAAVRDFELYEIIVAQIVIPGSGMNGLSFAESERTMLIAFEPADDHRTRRDG